MLQFVQDSFNNGVQRVKELTQPSAPSTPDGDSGRSEGSDDHDSEIDCDTVSTKSESGKYRNRKHKVGTCAKESSPSSSSEEEEEESEKGVRARKSHVSRGRGAKLTALRVLLFFCVIFSMVRASTAAGNDSSVPRSAPHLFFITLVALFGCAWFGARRAAMQRVQVEEGVNGISKPVFHRPVKDPCEPSGEAVDSKTNSQPPPRDDRPSPLQLLPGSRTVCVLASDADTATISTTAVPDEASNSYSANIGFEAPGYPLYQQQRLEPLRPYVLAVMAIGDPTPEKGVRNPQLLHKFSELVVGGGGSSPDPFGGRSRSHGIGNQSFSRTVSFPYEDSNIRSFNADALGVPSDDIVKDDTVLPSGGGRSHGANQRGNIQEQEEYVYRPFVDSTSDSEDDDTFC